MKFIIACFYLIGLQTYESEYVPNQNVVGFLILLDVCGNLQLLPVYLETRQLGLILATPMVTKMMGLQQINLNGQTLQQLIVLSANGLDSPLSVYKLALFDLELMTLAQTMRYPYPIMSANDEIEVFGCYPK